MVYSRLETLKSIVEKDPEDTFSRYALGLEYVSASMPELARITFEELISSQPDYLAAYYQLGKLYELIGENLLAAGTYETGINVAIKQNDGHTKEELEQALDEL
jgi:Tfp pilus assembly protein PilF